MIDKSEFEKKLAVLREDYKNKLPAKMDELSSIWKRILEQPNPETLALFHLKTHSLHGSADTFGYSELGKTAGRLETLADTILKKPDLITENTAAINELLNELKTFTVKEDQQPQVILNKSAVVNQAMSIYLLDNDKTWANSLASQLTTFGYQIQQFT